MGYLVADRMRRWVVDIAARQERSGVVDGCQRRPLGMALTVLPWVT
jgi:hypothetical protein